MLPISLDFCIADSTAVIKLIWKKRCLNQIKQIKEYLISHGWLLFVRLRKPWASQEKQLFSHTYRLLLHCSGTNEVPNSLPLHKDNCERVSKSLFASFSMACGERNGNATVNKNRKKTKQLFKWGHCIDVSHSNPNEENTFSSFLNIFFFVEQRSLNSLVTSRGTNEIKSKDGSKGASHVLS